MIGKTESAVKRMARRNGRVPVHAYSPAHKELRNICKDLLESGFFTYREMGAYTIYYYPADCGENQKITC